MLGDQLHLSVQTEDSSFSLNCYLTASQSLESKKQLSLKAVYIFSNIKGPSCMTFEIMLIHHFCCFHLDSALLDMILACFR